MLSPVSERSPRRKAASPPAAVRLIGGRWRRSLLPVADRPGLRPTPARVRETLFNWLGPQVEGSRCLDLFAGSGALGLEAASRGASDTWLVERDAALAASLQRQVERLQDSAGVRVVAEEALRFLQGTPPARFDLVFLDPPYADALLQPAWQALHVGGWLAPQALVYAEWPAQDPPPLAQPPWRLGRAGAVVFALFRPGADWR